MSLSKPAPQVALPQKGERFITDAGLETELVFHDGIDLPCFCAGVLLDSADGRKRLQSYYKDFVHMARRYDCGLVIETSTWRLNLDYAQRLGLSRKDISRLNNAAVQELQNLRLSNQHGSGRFVIGGLLGPRFDGYSATELMSPETASDYHSDQVKMLRDAGADCISALTITNTQEAIGIADAARKAETPAVISFTLGTNGRLPSGESLGEAINLVDETIPDTVSYFGINCAHPTHFEAVIDTRESWVTRIGSIRANASTMSHEELDNAVELDSGDPVDLGRRYQQLQTLLPNLRVMGGCCGTDKRHIESICSNCFSVGKT